MKKLCKISNTDVKYPRGITPKIIEAHFGDKSFDVDVYQDLQGKLFYKHNLNCGGVGDVFIRLSRYDKAVGRLFFSPCEFYLKRDNNIHSINHAYKGYDVWKDIIARNMPVDTVFYQVLADGEWGYYDIQTPNSNGVLCNAALFDAEESREKNLPIPEDLFPIIGFNKKKELWTADAKLGKLYVAPGKIYI